MLNLTNYAFINELRSEVGRDVVLFGADGIAYFGNLLSVGYDGIAVLGPATLSSTGFVQIRNPGGFIVNQNLTYVDLSFIVAKGASITADPFEIVTDAENTEVNSANKIEKLDLTRFQNNYSCNQCELDLIKRLRLQIGDLVTIATLGGFLFAGTLATVNNMVAKLTVDSIFVPGGENNQLSGINLVIINLNAMTSFST